MSLKHRKSVNVADDPAAAGKLRPSDWGSPYTDYDTAPTHVFDGGAIGALAMRDTGSVDGFSWLPSAAGVLVSDGDDEIPVFRPLIAADIPALPYASLDLTGSIVDGDIVSLAWSKLTGTPTTIGGYGITDFNSLGDARWDALGAAATVAGNLSAHAALTTTAHGLGASAFHPDAFFAAAVHTHAWADIVSGKPTTLAGYGITDSVVLTDGSYADPGWITSLAATKLTGTIADARLSANVPLLGSANTFTELQTFNGGVEFIGSLVVGGVTPPSGVEGYFVSTSDSDPRGLMSAQYSTDTLGAQFHFRKGRGTEAAPTTVVTGDLLGRIRFSGYDGANYLQMGSIEVGASGTVASTRVPTYMAFSVATNAAPSVLTERVRIINSGFVGIGTTSPLAPLVVTTPGNNAGLEFFVSGSAITMQAFNRTGGAYSSLISDALAFQFRAALTSGNLFAFKAATAIALAAATVGINLDLATSVTPGAASLTGYAVTFPATPSANANAYKGLSITAGAVTSIGTTTWTGLDVTMPAITQTSGSLTSVGLKITGGTVTSGTSKAIVTDATAGAVQFGGAFGCNGATPQTAAASGGALATYGAGANGFDTAANASALHALVVAIRAALVANGIMS